MNALAATAPVPSLLPDDAVEWVAQFSVRMRDEVVRPLFAAADAEAFDEELQRYLFNGAILRYRWLMALNSMPPEQSTALLNLWMRPLPSGALDDLEQRATRILGADRSFQLRRALALTFSDADAASRTILERWGAPRHAPTWCVEYATLSEATAPHDVLALAWIMVLVGEVPEPTPEVAAAAATALLDCAARRLDSLRAAIDGAFVARNIPVAEAPEIGAWLKQNTALIGPLCLVLGFALDDENVAAIDMQLSDDPEDPDLTTLVITFSADGDPDAVLTRIDERMLATGALGELSVDGAAIALLATERHTA